MVMAELRIVFITAMLMVASVAIAADAGEYYGDNPLSQSCVLPGYTPESARELLDASPLQPIEGIWEYPDEMITVLIEHFESPRFSRKIKYRIVLIDSEDMSLLPGTVIGYIAESADNHKFELWLYSEHDGMRLFGPGKCVATLTDNNTSLTFKKNSLKVRLRFNLSRFLPKLFRFISIYPSVKKEELPVGFNKIYPAYDDNGSIHHEIRYL